MAIDIREISLSDEQKRRIAEVSEQTGEPWREVLDKKLGSEKPAGDAEPDARYNDRFIEDREKWLAYFRDWVAKQTSHNPNFDDSRESIYP